jgi:hypothetical protein
MTNEETPQEETLLCPKSRLARAIANGQSIDKWAKANDVKRRTAFYWAKEPEVRAEVDTFRRVALNRALGKLNRHTVGAANQIIKLYQSASSESVQLAAARTLFSDVMSVSKFSTLEHRVTDLEDNLRAHKRGGGRPSPSPAQVPTKTD